MTRSAAACLPVASVMSCGHTTLYALIIVVVVILIIIATTTIMITITATIYRRSS